MTISQATLKYVKSLQLRKFRQKYNNFIAEGDKIVLEIIQHLPAAIEQVYAVPEWIRANDPLLFVLKNKIQEISAEELKKISGLVTPNQVLAIVQKPDFGLNADLIRTDLSLYLDDIQDPGNMGTILRIADWFGIRQVICSPHCVEIFSTKVVQASMGAFLRVKTVEKTVSELKTEFPDMPFYGAVLDGANIFKTPLEKKGILIIGNESKGIAKETEALLTHRIAIPSAPGGGAESLNAAIATGILVAVFRNQ